MEKEIDLMTSSYAKGLKIILKNYEAFCTKHELVEATLETERSGNVIEVTWLISWEEVESIQEVYQDFISFTENCEEEVELSDVSFDEEAYFATYRIKRTYALSPL